MKTYDHPRWDEFLDRLDGPEGINAHENDAGKLVWDCAGGTDKTHARTILRAMGLSNNAIEDSLEFFNEHGGYCDCEILMNVDNG